MLEVSSHCWTNGETTKDNEQCEKEECSIHYFCLAPLSDSSLQLWTDCSSEVFPVHCWAKTPLIPHCYSCPPRGFFSFSLSFSVLWLSVSQWCTSLSLMILLKIEKCIMQHIHIQHICGWQGWRSAVAVFLSDKAKHTLLLLWEYYRKNLIITIIATQRVLNRPILS